MVYFWNFWKMVFWYSRKDITYELLGILTLVQFNKTIRLRTIPIQCIRLNMLLILWISILILLQLRWFILFYKTIFPYGMIFIKADASTSDEQVEKLTGEFNIHYRACIRSLINFLYTWVDLSLVVNRLEKFSSNFGKVHFEILVHLLRYIRYYKTLELKYHDDINYALLSDMLRGASIKTENQLMAFFGSSWQDCLETDTST